MNRHLTARGYLQEAERKMLYYLASLVPENGKICNIGIEYGASMVCLTDGSPVSATVTGIDISLDRYVGPRYPNRNFRLIQDRSENVLKTWKDDLDLIFIDGDHSRQGLIKDLGWIEWLKPGGHVAFHDCSDYGSCDPNKKHHICPEVDEEVQRWYDANQSEFSEQPRACTVRTFKRL